MIKKNNVQGTESQARDHAESDDPECVVNLS